MKPAKTTPMIQQYLSIKEQYPDAILFYRMGDFYEMFFEDAQRASKVLEIALTSRNKNDDVPIPMCGVPFRAAQSYIARLISKGFKVAICDQIEDPAKAKGLVKRDVVRVVTAGTVLENELLEEKKDNFILALARQGNTCGMAHLDISTGRFRLTETRDVRQLVDEVLRIAPAEIIVPESFQTDTVVQPMMQSLADLAIAQLEDRLFAPSEGRERLLRQLGVLNLEGFGCEDRKAAVGAAGALLDYVQQTQKQGLTHLSRLESYFLEDFLRIDDLSCRNLELSGNIRDGSRRGTLLEVLDRTVTAMGGRLLSHWLRYPLMDAVQIEDRLEAVEQALQNQGESRQVRQQLDGVYDLERLTARLSMGHGNARDLLALRHSLAQLPEICDLTDQFESPLLPCDMDLQPFQELVDLIGRSIREDAPPTIHEGGLIQKGYNAELDDLIAIAQDGKGWLANLEREERERTGIQTLKVRFNKVFGYYIEVPKARGESVPDHYVRKQTLVNAERFITDTLKTFETKVLGAEEKRAQLEYEIFCDIRGQAQQRQQLIQQAARYIARLDCLLNLAIVANDNDYCRPQLNDTGLLLIGDGRHPVVEKTIAGERYVPNTIEMDNQEKQIHIITGPNMAGKSTVLRQVALTVIMAHMGSFVPAHKAKICQVDRIFTRVGALDNLSQGQSTFMVEMQETANILNNATGASLVVMDEIGRGTSTFDGLSIAWAVAEYLHDYKDIGVKTLFATHYHELTELAKDHVRVQNYNIAVKEWNDDIIFLRKLVDGGTNRSYGIQVARLAGIPSSVIQRAKKVLFEIENRNQDEPLTIPEKSPQKPHGHQQMALFRPPADVVAERLRYLNVEKMTPIEALNCLHELQAAVCNEKGACSAK